MERNLNQYFDEDTKIYHLVDEQFIKSFSMSQGTFMLAVYYDFYCDFCNGNGIKTLPMSKFLKNARRRKIKLVQICCPYCGHIDLIIWNRPCSELDNLKYCTNCGKCSTSENIFSQISALIRMREVYEEGVKAIQNTQTNVDLEIISYDVWHMELIELTSILEAVLRDFYFDMLSLKLNNYESEYLTSVVEKSTNNDFMNVEKANNHYKKGLNINLKELVSEECWSNLVDLSQIRNTVIHNNGMVDKRFRDSNTYEHIKTNIDGNLIFIDKNMLSIYFTNALELFLKLEEKFNVIYEKEMPSLIANHYFNSNLKWESLNV